MPNPRDYTIISVGMLPYLLGASIPTYNCYSQVLLMVSNIITSGTFVGTSMDSCDRKDAQPPYNIVATVVFICPTTRHSAIIQCPLKWNRAGISTGCAVNVNSCRPCSRKDKLIVWSWGSQTRYCGRDCMGRRRISNKNNIFYCYMIDVQNVMIDHVGICWKSEKKQTVIYSNYLSKCTNNMNRLALCRCICLATVT